MPDKIQKIKGTNDILPGEIEQWHALEATIHMVMERFTYREIRPPIFERTELFARGVGEDSDIVSKEMYTFSDTSGNSITLRPELTASVVRSYIQNNLQQEAPVQKLWYEGPMFRQERPQKGRYRQFWQFGIEAIGSPHPEQDVEVIALFHAILVELGISDHAELRINSIGDTKSRDAYREALRKYLLPHLQDLSAASRQRYDTNPLRILDSKAENDREIIRNAPRIAEFLNEDSTNHYAAVLSTLRDMEIPFTQDDLMVRGLDYYTHTTFEFSSDALGAQDAICGGGRYDNLIEQLGGASVPAIGWASGIERLLLVMESLKEVESRSSLDVYLVLAGDALRSKSQKLLKVWRAAGLNCDADTLRRSLKAQMREANRRNSRYAAILGEDEFAQQEIQMKDLETGEQKTIALDGVCDFLDSAD